MLELFDYSLNIRNISIKLEQKLIDIDNRKAPHQCIFWNEMHTDEELNTYRIYQRRAGYSLLYRHERIRELRRIGNQFFAECIDEAIILWRIIHDDIINFIQGCRSPHMIFTHLGSIAQKHIMLGSFQHCPTDFHISGFATGYPKFFRYAAA